MKPAAAASRPPTVTVVPAARSAVAGSTAVAQQLSEEVLARLHPERLRAVLGGYGAYPDKVVMETTNVAP